MLRILIMSLLGLSGIFLETFASENLPAVSPSAEKISKTIEAEGIITPKAKRHGVYPCPQSHQSYGTYIPQAASYSSGHYQTHQTYQKPIVIPSYQHILPKVETTIGYQKPIQIVQKPSVYHHAAAYNVQPTVVKQQVQYVHQPIYTPVVKEQPISYVKSIAPTTVSYNNVQKLISGYVKPVQYIPPAHSNNILPVKTYTKKVSYDFGSQLTGGAHSAISVQNHPINHMQSYYPTKQYFQPISYYSKPTVSQSMPYYFSSSANYMNKWATGYSGSDIVYKPKPNLISVKQPIADCEKVHNQPQVSYVKLSQPVVQQIHQPVLQYAPKYQQPMIQYAEKYQQPIVHFVQKVHQPVVQQPVYHYAPKLQQSVNNFAANIHHQPYVNYAPKINHHQHQPIAQNIFVKYAQQPMIEYGHGAQHSLSIVAPASVNHGVNYQSHIVGVNQPCHK